jgi:hypothetical protein
MSHAQQAKQTNTLTGTLIVYLVSRLLKDKLGKRIVPRCTHHAVCQNWNTVSKPCSAELSTSMWGCLVVYFTTFLVTRLYSVDVTERSEWWWICSKRSWPNFNVLSPHSAGGTEKNHRYLNQDSRSLGLRFEPRKVYWPYDHDIRSFMWCSPVTIAGMKFYPHSKLN